MKVLLRIMEALLLWFSFFCICKLLTGIGQCDLMYLLAIPSAGMETGTVAGCAAVAAAAAMWFLRQIPAGAAVRCWCVWLGMIPFLLLPEDRQIYAVFALIFLAGWSVCRLSAYCGGRSLPRLPERDWLWLLLLSTLLFIGQGLWFYREALNRLYLFWEDWGIFNEAAWNTLQGRWLQVDIHGGENFFGDHFMPGFFLWFTPLLGVVRSPLLLPVLGALFLWGSAGLVYRLARSCRFSPAESFCCALVLLFNPVINNLNLSGSYGTHVISFFIPLLLLFYCLRQGGHSKWAFAVFLFSLTVKESISVFWTGWSLCMMVDRPREWRKYAFTGGIALAYFLVVTQGIIPFFSGGYRYEAQYGALGGGMGELMLSPLLRPAAFWGTLAREKNLLLLLFLLLPVCFAVFRRWRLIPAALLLAGLNMLRGNPAMVNFQLHHNTECAAFLLALCVTALAERGMTGSDRLFFAGVRLPGVWRRRRALLGGVLVSTLLSYWFFAQGAVGAADLPGRLARYPDCSGIFSELRSLIPPGVCFSGDSRTATALMLRNRFVPWGSPQADYCLYNAAEHLQVGEARHREMLQSPEFQLIWARIGGEGEFYLFRRRIAPAGRARTLLTEEAFAALPGREIRSADPAFQVRVVFIPPAAGQGAKIRFLVRSRSARPDRAFFSITLFNRRERCSFRVPQPRIGGADERLEFTLDVPENWQNVTGLEFRTETAF